MPTGTTGLLSCSINTIPGLRRITVTNSTWSPNRVIVSGMVECPPYVPITGYTDCIGIIRYAASGLSNGVAYSGVATGDCGIYMMTIPNGFYTNNPYRGYGEYCGAIQISGLTIGNQYELIYELSFIPSVHDWINGMWRRTGMQWSMDGDGITGGTIAPLE